ncbi:MAG: DNA gyrase subunit B [Candidatus Heimdallarchaeota archaeon LC_2]|nr:MAG: DNA gyrase subunit B [Candidatus Heimdallarchaeota archaeon LC_2]
MSNYDESSIKVLEGTEGIRQRPAMYIGDVGVRGFHHLVYEVVDNSVDEAMANRCTKVELEIFEDNSIKITDDGVGIPAGIHPKYGISTLQVILTKLHSGGKFDKKAYTVSGGLHGIGLAAVCALSDPFHVESHRDGKIYIQNYSQGKLVDESTTDVEGDQQTGTSIHFKPDSSIFTETTFDFEKLSGRLKELAYLTEKFSIRLIDNREEEKILVDEQEIIRKKQIDYYFEGGIQKFVEDLVKGVKKDLIIPDAPLFYTQGESEGVVVEVAFAYIDSANEFDKGFVNNINTHEGGTHVSGFRAVLTRSINKFAEDFNLLDKAKKSKKGDPDKLIKLSGSDVREGIIAIISVKVPIPQFEGQTKTKLGNSEVERIVQQVMKEPLEAYLNDIPNLGKAIVKKAQLARRIREASKKLTESMRKGGRVSLPGKLVSSHGKDPLKRELFLVEGQSAGGTAVKGRNSEYQEILFLRGKVLNVEKARLDRAMENAEIRNMITAIGMGIMDDIDIEKCRYGKVILLTDADVDGAHIATLLLTFFYRYMKPLIESGRLYIARPPLFRVQFKGEAAKWIKSGAGGEKAKDYIYLTYESDLNTLLDGLDEMQIDRKNLSINRFKGLGEMNANQLEETTMNVETRRVERININDVVDSEEWLTRLMGDDVVFRKKYIEEEVFEETGFTSRGPFYDNAFQTTDEEDHLALDDSERELLKEEASLDEYIPEQELLAAFDKYMSSSSQTGDQTDE